MKDAFMTLLMVGYNLTLLVGAAYLVEAHGWSMWTFLLAAIFFMSTGKREDK